ITSGMRQAYVDLHRHGHAHSVEVFEGDALVGGIYGVAIGRMFFGESMFSGRSGGSKVALAALAARLHGWGWPLIDAQVENDHLVSLGAVRMPRHRFLAEVAGLVDPPAPAGPWTLQFGRMTAAELAQASVP
ncbi:MAG: leucyl/phenylalanyl-tRNA--protein transferase, partial [Pseudoxanthomonas sp.]|nr:leucyl/phenylalanyl-tRNA--protein transferase [Pseudoxanthomonas sp.]